MALHLKPLNQQTIVITGTSSGIGLTTARMAAKAGANLVLVGRDEPANRALARELRGTGVMAIYVIADVGNEADVDRVAAEAIKAFGTFDTWVNNAGVSIFGKCMDVSIADMRRMYDTNFWGTVYGSRAAVRHFRARGEPGALINIGSVFGDRANPVQSTYATSKNALHGWTDALRMELEKDDEPVSVTLVHPGRIDTPYNEHARNYMPQQPAHRGMIYPPEAVAEAILWAAAHPIRDMFVGSQAKAGALLGTLFPRLMDKFMEANMFYSQRSSRPAKPQGEDGLWHSGGWGLTERGTHEGALYRKRSYYVKATKRPLLNTALLAGAAAGGLAWLWAAGSGTKRGE